MEKYNYSDNFDWKSQRKCPKCNKIYNLIPEYKYDNWNLGDYGCKTPTRYISGYKDAGCPYCEKQKRKKKDIQIAKYETVLKKCSVCGKARIKSNQKDEYFIECRCLRTKETVTFQWIPKLISIWNKLH